MRGMSWLGSSNISAAIPFIATKVWCGAMENKLSFTSLLKNLKLMININVALEDLVHLVRVYGS